MNTHTHISTWIDEFGQVQVGRTKRADAVLTIDLSDGNPVHPIPLRRLLDALPDIAADVRLLAEARTNPGTVNPLDSSAARAHVSERLWAIAEGVSA